MLTEPAFHQSQLRQTELTIYDGNRAMIVFGSIASLTGVFALELRIASVHTGFKTPEEALVGIIQVLHSCL